jgi:hypothetical protein
MKYLLIASAYMIAAPALAQDAAKSAALDRFMKAVRADDGYSVLGYGAIQSFTPLAAINPGKEQAVGAIVKAELEPQLRKYRPIYSSALRAAYARRFTTAELNSLSVFLESPVWAKLQKAQVEAQDDANKSLVPLQKTIQSTVSPRILAKMKAQGLKTESPKQ